MKSIREMIDQYISETGEAHLEHRRGEGFGVVFHDEGQFILLSDLAYNSKLGFFQVSLFPDQPREAEYIPPPPTQWTTAVFTEKGGPTEADDYQMYAIIPDDDTNGFIIGEWPSVVAVYEALGKLIESKQADEQVSEYDERLGRLWLSVTEASLKFNVPIDSVRYAAREGFIPLAEKQGNEWRFPQGKFLWWLNKVYKPREK
jgi:hypothetical protein